MVVGFFIKLIQPSVIGERESQLRKGPPSDWPISKPRRFFFLMAYDEGRGQSLRGLSHLWMGGPGLCKK